MKTADHLALGHQLLSLADHAALRKHKYAFLLGCIEPDYNTATYMRGILHHKRFYGHNAENSLAHITKCIERFAKDGITSAWDYFTLGTMLHYVADAFTWPHNEFWNGNLLEHAAYERQLHGLFMQKLGKITYAGNPDSEKASVQYFTRTHKCYASAPHRMETDCRYITNACAAMLQESLLYADPTSDELNEIKRRAVYEGAYYHGLV